MAKRTKTLNLLNLDKEHKKLDEQLTVQIGDFTIEIDKHIKKSKVYDMIAEIMVQMSNAKKNKIDLTSIFVPYSVLMFIKHFTSFNKLPNDLDKQIAVMKKLIDLDLIEPIMGAFDKDEVEAVFSQVRDSMSEGEAQIQDMEARFREAFPDIEIEVESKD
jgi:hypothetical protein